MSRDVKKELMSRLLSAVHAGIGASFDPKNY
jgi:hypothetical protein